MSPLSSIILAAAAVATLAAAAPHLAAQQQPPPDAEMQAAEAALASCAAAAQARRNDAAMLSAQRAESVFRARIARNPRDVRALVGLAQTLGQCRIPLADLLQAGELSAESVELLQRALEVEPAHWRARYVLALNYYRAPSFLGRSPDAAREFDRLIEQQGERTDVGEFARPFEYRGLLWSRGGLPDSAVAVWRRGLRLFPSDSALRARLRLSDKDALDDPDDGAQPAPALRTEVRAPVTMDTTRVVVSRSALASARPGPSRHTVARSAVLTSAGAMGDVLHAVQLQPGATRAGEAADLHARGGDPAETATYISGGRVLSVSRFEGLNGGLFGTLDPFVVRSARFSTGGFSVRYGNALSGLLEIETDGRPRETQWRLGAGLTQLGATARLPLGARSGAWGTLRATQAGALLMAHGRQSEFNGSPRSTEGMASYILEPRPGTELRVLGSIAGDASARVIESNGYSGPFDSRGSSRALVLSAQHIAATLPIAISGTLTRSERSTDWSFGVLSRERAEQSTIARAELEYAAAPAVTIRTGVEVGRWSRAGSGMFPTTPSVAPGSPVETLARDDTATASGGGFAEGEFRVGPFSVLAGARLDRLPGESELTMDPRISISTRRDAWTFRLGAGAFHQGRWRPEASIPDPGTPGGLPREARHYIAGVQRDGVVSIRAESFVKQYREYGAFGAGPQIREGRARGIDLLAHRAVGERFTGWLGYSLLDYELQLEDGRRARSAFDVTTTLTGSGTLRLARNTTLGTSLLYGTGRPVTPVIGTHELHDGRPEPIYGEPTSERLPAYARWDMRLMRYIPLRRSLLTAYAELLNALDRANVSGYTWDATYRNRRPTHTFYSSRTLIVGVEIQSR